MRAYGPIWRSVPLRRASKILFGRLVTAADANTVSFMPATTLARPKKDATHRATKKFFAHGIKAAPGNPFAGLEPFFGSIALPRDPRTPREILRAHYLADHNT